MLSEEQIKELLLSCEQSIGKELIDLRKRLLAHKNYNATIWELIVLYIFLTGSVEVDHEPSTAMPDICLAGGSVEKLFIEATVVSSRTKEQSERIDKFRSWLRQRVEKEFQPFTGAIIDLGSKSKDSDISIPPEHEWKSMLGDQSWKYFLSELTSTNSGIWVCPLGNVTVRFSINDTEYISGGHAVPNLPKIVDEHVVYRAIKNKGQQIKQWSSDVKSAPIVLVIGCDEVSSEFNSNGFGIGLKEAIYNALLDPHKMGLADRYNILRNGAIVGIRSKQVNGARHISAVVFVNLIAERMVLSPRNRKIAKVTLFENAHADIPLNESQRDFIQKMNFNRIEYGPGWEAWQDTKNQDLSERARMWGGSMVISSRADGGFTIEIPTVLLTRILAGDLTAQDASDQFCDSPPQLIQLFKKALENNQQLLEASVVSVESLSREEARVRLNFSGPQPSVIARAKNRQ